MKFAEAAGLLGGEAMNERGNEYGCDIYADFSASSNPDIEDGSFPPYEEEFPRIIGMVKNEQDSFCENKLEIYRRNNLIAFEEELADREAELQRRKAEQLEIKRLNKKNSSRRFLNNFNRIVIIAGIAVLALPMIFVGTELLFLYLYGMLD